MSLDTPSASSRSFASDPPVTNAACGRRSRVVIAGRKENVGWNWPIVEEPSVKTTLGDEVVDEVRVVRLREVEWLWGWSKVELDV